MRKHIFFLLASAGLVLGRDEGNGETVSVDDSLSTMVKTEMKAVTHVSSGLATSVFPVTRTYLLAGGGVPDQGYHTTTSLVTSVLATVLTDVDSEPYTTTILSSISATNTLELEDSTEENSPR